jgi:hypothetical protein
MHQGAYKSSAERNVNVLGSRYEWQIRFQKKSDGASFPVFKLNVLFRVYLTERSFIHSRKFVLLLCISDHQTVHLRKFLTVQFRPFVSNSSSPSERF